MIIPCFILCRKGSKEIKGKNNIKIGKKSLFEITFEYVKKSKYVSHIVVSTDDKKIFRKAKNKSFLIARPKSLSTSLVSSEKVLKHAIKTFEKKYGKTKYSCYVQVTEPFRPKNILDDCIKKIIKTNSDSCFAAYEQKKNFWVYKKNKLVRMTNFSDRKKPRQIKNPILREDTGIALVTKSKFLRKGERIGNKISCVSYKNPKFNIDINSLEDLNFARKIHKSK